MVTFSFFTKALLVALMTGNLGGAVWCQRASHSACRNKLGHTRLYDVTMRNRNLTEDYVTGDSHLIVPLSVKPARVHGVLTP
jgi:hypothetical protein